MARRRRQQRPSKKTALLIVGEGAHDQAFIKHIHHSLRSQQSNIRPKIEKQSGGSPAVIIENAIRKYQHLGFDKRFIVLDSDIPIAQQDRDKARKKGYSIILWEPVCLEGTLLDVLGEKVQPTESAQALKARVHPRLSGHPAVVSSYANLFPLPVLSTTSNTSVSTIREILSNT